MAEVRRPMLAALAFASALLAGGPAGAQSVALAGSFGSKALLVIDGVPRTLAPGESAAGVRLVGSGGSDAVVEVRGKRVTLAMGAAPMAFSGAASASSRAVDGRDEGGAQQIVLTAASGGHFVAGGAINGHAARFLVDTGATNVSMGESEAAALGIDFRAGEPGWSNTANGLVAIHRVSLTSVRVGDVTVYQVDATVVPTPMPFVLLGNSFLTRFQMRRDNDMLTLVKRP